MKIIKYLLVIVITFSSVNAQKIKLKKGEVLLDGKAIMKYERYSMDIQKLELYSLDSDEELISINKNNNETSGYYDDDYIQIKFLTVGEIVENKMTAKSFKYFIGWLIKKKIISTDGTLNEKNIPLFVKNNDENITNRTMRN